MAHYGEIPQNVSYNKKKICLDSAACVHKTCLRIADAAARLIGADTVSKIIVVRTKGFCTVAAHPGAACSLADCEANAAVLWVELGEDIIRGIRIGIGNSKECNDTTEHSRVLCKRVCLC